MCSTVRNDRSGWKTELSFVVPMINHLDRRVLGGGVEKCCVDSVLAAAAGSCLFYPTSISAKPLEPTGRWVVDYRVDQYRLAFRQYSNSGKPVTFGIRPAPNGETYLLLLAQKRFGPEMAKQQSATVDFGNRPIRSWILEYRDKPTGSDIYQFRISAAEMDQARAASSVKLSLSNAPGVELRLELMSALIKSLEDCTADLKRYWNLGGEKDGRIATLSKGDIRHLFSAGDYPAEAYYRVIREEQSQFILLIDGTGKVVGCDVVNCERNSDA